MERLVAGRFFYGWIVVGVTALTLLCSAAVATVPTVFIVPLGEDLGWGPDVVGFAVAFGLLLFGLAGPVAGRLVDRYGPKVIMLAGVVLAAVAMFASATMTEAWQLTVYWGLVRGVGIGITAAVLAASVASRWFVARRGLVMGIFGGATSAGQMIFIPVLTLLVGLGWRSAAVVVGVMMVALLLPIVVLMRDDPAEVGATPLGGSVGASRSGASLRQVMGAAVRTPEFWLLAGSFFVCGATSNGLIGTHFVPHAADHGISAAKAAGVLSLMGAMNFVGTVGSGWLTDRFDPRKLLGFYYTFRGLSLLLLPLLLGSDAGLVAWAVLFGLDYIATVPPTVMLVSRLFGRQNTATVFGWVFCSHQVGAALVAYWAGVARTSLGDYQLAFLVAGVLAVLGALLSLSVSRQSERVPLVQTA